MLYNRSLRDQSDMLDVFNLECNDVIDESLLSPEGTHHMRTVFMEICFINRIQSTLVHKFYKYLVKRTKDIEKVINNHFNMIKEPLIAKKKQEFENIKKKRT